MRVLADIIKRNGTFSGRDSEIKVVIKEVLPTFSKKIRILWGF